MKSGFWNTDWFLGVVVVIAVLIFSRASDLIPSLERKGYDMGVQATSRPPSDKIAVIAIDDTSIANIGRWPWSREIHAKMTDLLAAAKAKVIANTVFFSEPQIDPGYQYVTKLLELASKAEPQPPEMAPLVTVLKEAEQALNTDRKLAESYAKAGNVLLPMLFVLAEPRGKPDKPLPDYVLKNAVAAQGARDAVPLQTAAVQIPIDAIGKAAAGLGHLNSNPDVDGGIRTEPLVLQFFDQYYPSLSMMIAAKSLNLAPSDIKLRLGEGVTLGRLRIGTDPALQMYTYFYKDRDGRQAFQVDSFYDVLTGKIPAAKYADKIVLIGATAAGVGSTSVTPVSPAMAPVVTLAHSVSSILQEHFFVAPAWAYWVELLLILLVAAYLIALLPRLKASAALAISGGAFAALLILQFASIVSGGVWMQLMLPATLLLVGHAALVSKRFIVTEAAKVKSDETSAESNRMLGLAYQGQGQLDLAWDKFRQVPLSDGLLDNLYNLALDYERKRQFNKAESVFRYMHGFNPKFRDLEQKLSRAKQLSETVILGGAGASHPGGTMVLGTGTEKPMLGRYQVEKELGKGAMGVVYLGKDPKIGRQVAIKTMALAQEFEAEELAEVKERFFREAETAGRLNHPNIVSIYDAGEEHDLCYIAMELLKGGDLVPYCKQGNLLPVDKVVSIIARVADALGYAHKQNVVHRDIKPANVMYHLETDSPKVTDFGIARLTDSSKTKTGMVLGTPSYMSPEQLSGKKVDGRSDLFSLAGSLYQMLCGKLPFEGESMAQLMFKIANEPPADLLSIRPDLPPGLATFLARAMAKNADERFQTGEEFAAALRAAFAGGAAAAAPAAAAPAAPAAKPAAAAGGGVDIEL
ncbi:MAG: serine/threonine protein kinase [Betaproteobacteria bacterium RIFCSPHIGHO2_12_FULL_69_13]|nr:MAG: serine/threonine protein kinase [Betaproteobacteria bacterium RIFCSPHIGHO2_12_FULL_69_13]OGA71117.1 MAG: serine/threonine protein kinase [Betaproteobacteria bacterium RIFCSPLOWO2_12_FULL_68_20]